MIQDIGTAVYQVDYQPEAPKDKDIVYVFETRRIFAKMGEEKQIALPTFGQLKDQLDTENLQYLFKIDEQCFYLYNGALSLEDYDYISVGYLRLLKTMREAFAGMTAYHLYTWYSGHRFCGKCGHKMTASDKERVLICPDCGHRVYPVIAPAVIVGVTRGDDILVTRYAGREYKGVALLAGFCEIGENAEETVRREVFEEVGIKLKNIRYYASQPWGIDSNLLLGFFAELDGSDAIVLDTNELREAVWMPRSELKPAKNTMSLTMTMIEAFRNGDV